MHWTVWLLTILLSGCHGLSLLERSTEDAQPQIMRLWGLYQRCLATTDPTEFVLIIDQFERVMLPGAEPPSWLKAWGRNVMSQPLRTVVDPQALGAVCTLRAARVIADLNRPAEARALYERVLMQYGHRDWAYYVDQAKGALAGLSNSAPAVIASRSTPASSR